MSDTTVALPNRADLPWYLASSGLALAAMSLQGFLIQWLLVFYLRTDAMQLGFSRALMELPPIILLLLGGIYADRTDGRRMLLWISGTAALVPLVVAATLGHLSYWVVIAFGAAMAALQSAGDPARAAMLNRVTRMDIQRTVTAMTVVTTFIALGAFWVGGRIEFLGLANVLVIQAALFALSAFAVGRLPPFPPAGAASHLLDGLRALRRTRVLRNVLGINFASAFFNAGAYIVVMPLVVREVYQADAAFLASMMIAFTVGSSGSNALLFLFMPLKHPGRLFLVMQLTRAVILAALWWEPPAWLFFVLVCAWGVNMGITSTLVRTTAQEMAPAEHRAKILSLLLATFLIASPISALTLGFVVDATDAPSGLLPGVLISLVLFAVGILSSGLWHFESPSFASRKRARSE